MPLDPEGRDFVANAFGTNYSWLALFDGATELSGGSPAYARIQFTAAVGSTGDGQVSIPPVGPFNVPAGATVDGFAVFDSASGGERGGLEPLDTPTPAYAAQGEFNFTGGTITATST